MPPCRSIRASRCSLVSSHGTPLCTYVATPVQDISRHVSMADIRRLLPLQKAVTALEYDIKETALAVDEVRPSPLPGPEHARCKTSALTQPP